LVAKVFYVMKEGVSMLWKFPAR